MTWILLVLAQSTNWGEPSSVSMVSVPGFAAQSDCQAAGMAAVRVGNVRFVCLSQPAGPASSICYQNTGGKP